MIVLTGWTHTELRHAPASLVRRLMWRVFARNLWNEDLAQTARTTLPPDASFEAKVAKGDVVKLVQTLETALWPEDDDGR